MWKRWQQKQGSGEKRLIIYIPCFTFMGRWKMSIPKNARWMGPQLLYIHSQKTLWSFKNAIKYSNQTFKGITSLPPEYRTSGTQTRLRFARTHRGHTPSRAPGTAPPGPASSRAAAAGHPRWGWRGWSSTPRGRSSCRCGHKLRVRSQKEQVGLRGDLDLWVQTDAWWMIDSDH